MMDFIVVILFSIGIFFAGMFVMTQYSLDMLEWVQSNKEDNHIFFVNSSAIIRFRVLWGIAAAIMFIIGLFIAVLVM